MGISLSNTARRRAPTHPYVHHHHHTVMNYYGSYPANPSPYPAHPASSPLAYYPTYHTSNAYTVCNNPNPLVGQPYFGGPFELQQALPQPRDAAAVLPPCGEQKAAKVVNSDVNVHKDTLRLEVDELNPDQCLVSFIFDALVDGSITICYFAKEEPQRQFVSLFPETYVPIKVPFRKGLRQEFRQPLGTGIDLRFFSLYDLSNPSSRDDVFPIVISADTCLSPYMFDDRNYVLAHTSPQMQITQVAVMKNNDGQFAAKVIRQLLWSDDTCYELRDIYGLGKSGQGCSDSGSGKDCVICLTEPKDTALLPCRHMCMCSNCAKTLRLQSNKCPICREIIESLLEIKTDNTESEVYSLSLIS
ncbi:RING/U-box superfamily protein [Striga asiatica]|uniref:RING-type E3 ubiquitin transferase n=1 Tax=Striga asiatica TaxID=4170 RepID=A0A5A7PX38_STRAF|nr:RING/U-box superfamily protein [Striga asiatica]